MTTISQALNGNNARPAKISREVSNFILIQVLERSDDLIKNSYRRLTTENVARNEHWAKIAEIVSEKFDIPAEMERVKSHFHNRKKVLLARIKDELKNVPNNLVMTTEEKLEELVKRRICIGEHDEQLARVCLDIEEEEKLRTDQFGFETKPMFESMFTENSHQSLLTQLLTTHHNAHHLQHSSANSAASSKDSEPMFVPTPPPNADVTLVPQVPQSSIGSSAPLLSKLLNTPSTSNENGEIRGMKTPFTSVFPDRKRRGVSPFETRHRSPVLPSPYGQYLSHLIVDVTSSQELKRLLSVLIDNGFSRFQHVGSSELGVRTIPTGIRSISKRRVVEATSREQVSEDVYERDDATPFWTASIPSTEEVAAAPINGKIDVVKDIKSRVERVEVKVEPCSTFEDIDEQEEEIDEHTAELEAELACEALKNGLSLFFKPSSPKKMRGSGGSAKEANGEAVTAVCELCGTGIRLNPGSSKWNLFEHVMMKHSVHKAYMCPNCPYQAGRKVRVRQHTMSQHNVTSEPIDMATKEIRDEWLETMSKCFPLHQYDKKPTNQKTEKSTVFLEPGN